MSDVVATERLAYWKARARQAEARLAELERRNDTLSALVDHNCEGWEEVEAERDELRARLAKVEALCDAADTGYGAGIYGTDVSAHELREALAPPEDQEGQR